VSAICQKQSQSFAHCGKLQHTVSVVEVIRFERCAQSPTGIVSEQHWTPISGASYSVEGKLDCAYADVERNDGLGTTFLTLIGDASKAFLLSDHFGLDVELPGERQKGISPH
jgi:hypothetical protein